MVDVNKTWVSMSAVYCRLHVPGLIEITTVVSEMELAKRQDIAIIRSLYVL
jgi:hypothetical protein